MAHKFDKSQKSILTNKTIAGAALYPGNKVEAACGADQAVRYSPVKVKSKFVGQKTTLRFERKAPKVLGSHWHSTTIER